ncbi:hypothetical protein SUGI_0504300 [Cryptomeria japonica]|nr:hypothetical protein SUGI_0504300 [Cryptomeria japonica]
MKSLARPEDFELGQFVREEGLLGRRDIGVDEHGFEAEGNDWGLVAGELWTPNYGRHIEEITAAEAHSRCGRDYPVVARRSGHFLKNCPLLAGKNVTHSKKTSGRHSLHSASVEPSNPKQTDPTPPPLHPESPPPIPSNHSQPNPPDPPPPPGIDPPPHNYHPQSCPNPPSAPPSIAESLAKYQKAIKEANLAASTPSPLEPDVVGFPTNNGGPRTQNAQQIILEKLKVAAEHKIQLELSLSNQKKEIESNSMPFLHELIEGDDGGFQGATNAICFISPGAKCRGNWDILGEKNIPPIVASSNTPLEAKVEGEGRQNPTTPRELASGDIDGNLGFTIPPFDHNIEDDHGTGPCVKPDEFEIINNGGDKSFSPDSRVFYFGSNNGEGDPAGNKSKKKRRKISPKVTVVLKLDSKKFDKWIKEGATTVYICELSHRFTWEMDELGKATFEQALMTFMRQLDRRQMHMEIIQEEADLICERTSHPHKKDILNG